MPPRFLERMQRQSDVLRDVFGDPQNDPPPYPSAYSHTRSQSSTSTSAASSTFQYRRSRDLSAYQNRFSTDSTATSSSSAFHARHRDSEECAASASPSGELYYRPSPGASGDGGEEGHRSWHFPPPPPGYTPSPSVTPTHEHFDLTTFPRDSLVLVTGASGYLAQHVASQLLTHGYRVRGTVRTAEQAVHMAKIFRERFGAGRFTTAVIPDMAARGAFDLAVRGCAGVVHVASVTERLEDPEAVVTPSIAGAMNVVEACGKEVGVKRVVVCSCVSAAVGSERAWSGGRGMGREVVGGESWNMRDFEGAWAPRSSSLSLSVVGEDEGEEEEEEEEEVEGFGAVVAGAGEEEARQRKIAAVQASAKMQSEQAVWKWYSSRRPHFVLNTVLPDTLWGAPLTVLPTQQLPGSIASLREILEGGRGKGMECGHFVDVTDAAALHLAALLFPDVRHERVFAVSIPWTRRVVAEILARNFPERIRHPQPQTQSPPPLPQTAARARSDSLQVETTGVWHRRSKSSRSSRSTRRADGNGDGEAMDLTVFKEVERAEELLRRMGRSGWRDLEGSLRGGVEGFL